MFQEQAGIKRNLKNQLSMKAMTELYYFYSISIVYFTVYQLALQHCHYLYDYLHVRFGKMKVGVLFFYT